MAKSNQRRCGVHRTAAAGWHCAGCDADLCPDCVERLPLGVGHLDRCVTCRGTAQPITAHRSALPYATRIQSSWRYPLSASGLFSLAAFALLQAIGSVFIPLGWIVALVFWGYLFFLVRETAIGRMEIGPPDFSDFFNDMLRPTIRGIIASSVVWLPVVIYLVMRETPDPDAGWDPIVWLMVLAGFAYLPIALLMAATEVSTFHLFNPLLGIGYISQIGRDYWVAAAAVGGLWVVRFVAGLALGTTLGRIPFLGTVLVEGAETYLYFVIAHVLGTLLYVRGDQVGYGRTEDFEERVLDLPPRGRASQPSEETPLPPAPVGDAIALELEDERITALGEAVRRREGSRALTLFRGLAESEWEQVPLTTLLGVGQAAAGRGEYELAVRVLEAAALSDGTEADQARAWVLLARVYGEMLGNPQRAKEIYTWVVQSYPGSSAAQFAEKQLKAA